MARARGSTSAAAVQPSKGNKITFGEDDIEDDFEDSYEAGPSRTSRTPLNESDEEEEEEDEEDSDDDAPEAVGLGRNEDDVSAAAESLTQYVQSTPHCPR